MLDKDQLAGRKLFCKRDWFERIFWIQHIIRNTRDAKTDPCEIHQEVITVELDFRQQFQIMRGKGMLEIFTGRALGRKHQDRIFQKLFQRAGQMLEGKTVRVTYEHIVEIF